MTDMGRFKMLSFIKKLFKKEQKQENVVKEEVVDTRTSLEKYCSDNPESNECRIYDV